MSVVRLGSASGFMEAWCRRSSGKMQEAAAILFRLVHELQLLDLMTLIKDRRVVGLRPKITRTPATIFLGIERKERDNEIVLE